MTAAGAPGPPDKGGAATWWRIVGSAMLASVSASLAVFLVGALAVQIRHTLHFGPTTFGLAVSIFYLGAGAGSVPGGRLAETIGGVRVMRAMCVAASAVLVLLAVALRSWAALAVLLLLAGLVSATMQPAINLFLARRAPPGRQGVAFGVKQASVPASAVLGGLAVPAVALTVGWRWAFAAGALLALVTAAAIPRPRTTLAEHRSQPVTPLAPGSVRPLVVLATGLGLGIFAATGLSAFTATSAVAAGVAKPTAGLLVALGGASSVVARIVSGLLADRRGRAHLPVVAAMLVVGSAGFALLGVASDHRSLWLFAAGVVVAFGFGWGWNGLFNFAVVRTHPEAPGRATGITQVGGRLAGAAGPLLFGLVADHVSYSAAWALDGFATVAAAVTVLIGRRMLVRRLSSGSPAPAPGVAPPGMAPRR